MAILTSSQAAFRRSILICTGNPALGEDLKQVFSQRGFIAATAEDSNSALRTLSGSAPDVMLCDQSLPGVEGMALLQLIRRDRPELAGMPIIIISEFGEKSDIVAGKLAGADDYIAKPIHEDLLLASIDTLLRMSDRLKAAETVRAGSSSSGAQRLRAPYVLLDRFSFGVIMFDPFGQMIFTNRAAKSLSRVNTSTIREWVIRQAASQNGHGRETVDHVLDFRTIPTGVSRSNIPQHLFVATLQLTEKSGDQAIFAAAIFPSSHVSGLGDGLVAEAIGLTPTEARLAGFLAEGLRLDQIGEVMNIAKPTVNYHLRNIYQKCGYSRQSDLISLLRSVHLNDGTAPSSATTPERGSQAKES
ncbi:DNA-binding response regulator [Paracoccus aerodenitrificans]|uniref:DNA-binding response regulator n=1 Tax=Paracoccus aerodenitrificans TaxID=3017781 RepID=UPI0022EFEF6D|nr:DNA-binding response regulator [Paracoccus aerodenitrificans]WBU63455.1 DNA-binding response regulator [Paracoccus aerodenitrificans]